MSKGDQVTPGSGPAAGHRIAVSVHGPLGVLDLVVPAGAVAADVAREYAEQSGLGSLPLLFTRIGTPLLPDVPLAEAGVDSGHVLVATTSIHRPGDHPDPQPLPTRSAAEPGPISALWFAVAAGVAVLAGWFAADAGPSPLRTLAIDLLVLAAVLGVLPVGRYAAQRAVAAPAFGAAGAFALAWDPHPERLPMVVGIAALAAAVTAGVARALDEEVEEALRVAMIAGGIVFVVTGAAALLALSAAVVWSLLLVGSMLAARFVPGFAIDVPDQLLIDLDRLAVTAWSARDRPRGRRGRAVASPAAVSAVVVRGARFVTAACAAIAVVAVLSSALLLATVTADPDRIGARGLVFFAGGALLLAGRSYRHAAARALLRTAGLGCWAWLTATLLAGPHVGPIAALAGGAIALALAMIVVAVAAGRGWRSAWWARRAEVAEGLCGSAAVATVLVATGLFRVVWELTSGIGS